MRSFVICTIPHTLRKGSGHLGEQGVKGRFIFNCILKKQFDNEDWINLALQCPMGGFCEHTNEPLCSVNGTTFLGTVRLVTRMQSGFLMQDCQYTICTAKNMHLKICKSQTRSDISVQLPSYFLSFIISLFSICTYVAYLYLSLIAIIYASYLLSKYTNISAYFEKKNRLTVMTFLSHMTMLHKKPS